MSNKRIKGMYRVKIVDLDGTVVGDSGFLENLITQGGVTDIMSSLTSTSTVVSPWQYLALGTGATVAYTDVAPPGELTDMGGAKRLNLFGTDASIASTIGAASNNQSIVQFDATFYASYWDASFAIRNIGICTDSTGNSMMCGNTYSVSTLQSHQAAYVTYGLTLSQS